MRTSEISSIVPLVCYIAIWSASLIKLKLKSVKEVKTMAIQAQTNETTTISVTVSNLDDQKKELPVVTFIATLDSSNLSLSEQVSVLDKELYISNAADIKAQYANFRNTVVARAQALGYVIF